MSLPTDRTTDIVGMVYDSQTHLHTYFQRAKFRAEGTNSDYDAYGTATVSAARTAEFSTVLHEIGHALSAYHEHQRPDRDSYVVVNTTDGNYEKKTTANVRGGYDFASIMHYDSNSSFYRVDGSDFSKNYNAFSWRDLRGLFADYDLGDIQASASTEAAAFIDLANASDHAGRGLVYSTAAGRIYSDLVGVDADGSGYIRAYYDHAPNLGSTKPNWLTTSRGMEYDLARDENGGDLDAHEEASVSGPVLSGVTVSPSSIVGVVISDGETLAYFKGSQTSCASGLFRSRGSYYALDTVWGADCVSLPAGYTADDIRELARYRLNGTTRIMTVYADGEYSIGSTVDLGSVSGGTFQVDLVATGFPSPIPDATRILGFTLRGNEALFFLGCENGRTCQGDEYRLVKVPDFVSRLPAQYR
jgi:hypothetical protein